MCYWHGVRGSMQFYRGVKGFQQSKVAHIADKDHPSRLEDLHGSLQDLKEVLNRGKILDHRVEDNGIERGSWQIGEVIRLLLKQGHLGKILYLLLQVRQTFW